MSRSSAEDAIHWQQISVLVAYAMMRYRQLHLHRNADALFPVLVMLMLGQAVAEERLEQWLRTPRSD